MAAHKSAIGILFLLAGLFAACSGGKGGASVAPSGAGSPASGNDSAVPVVTGKLLETGQSTLDLIQGGHRTTLVKAPSPNSYFTYPSFSPDGQRIGYVLATVPTSAQTQDWGNDIYTAKVDGSDVKLVLKHDQPGALIDSLSWTPDGGSLVYAYYRSVYDAQGHYVSAVYRVERLDIADGKRTTLIDNAAQPSLSWDGKQIVYLSMMSQGSGFETSALAIANADGSQQRPMFRNQSDFNAIFAPHLSPDSKRVVFAAVGGPLVAPNASPSLSNLQRAPRPSAGDAIAGPLLSWLNPSAALADGSPYQIWVANVDGSGLHTLSNLREDLPFPLWATSGQSILFLGASGLYTVNPDGSNLKKLSAGVPHGEIAWYQSSS